jgi:DNA repair protein RadC
MPRDPPDLNHFDRRHDSYFDGERWVGYQTSIRMVRENQELFRPLRIRSPADIYRTFRSLADLDRERFYVVSLDTVSHVCGVEMVSQGVLHTAPITPREAYKGAILHSAAGIILVHNHPSGDPTPSPDDRAITRQLGDAGRILDLPCYDHVIIGTGRYVSFAEAGLL